MPFRCFVHCRHRLAWRTKTIGFGLSEWSCHSNNRYITWIVNSQPNWKETTSIKCLLRGCAQSCTTWRATRGFCLSIDAFVMRILLSPAKGCSFIFDVTLADCFLPFEMIFHLTTRQLHEKLKWITWWETVKDVLQLSWAEWDNIFRHLFCGRLIRERRKERLSFWQNNLSRMVHHQTKDIFFRFSSRTFLLDIFHLKIGNIVEQISQISAWLGMAQSSFGANPFYR